MKNINPRAWAHTPAKHIAHTDHLLDAWGDVFCRLEIRKTLQITFERFIEMPHHHLHRLQSRSLNFLDDRRLNLWGDIFCRLKIRNRLGNDIDYIWVTNSEDQFPFPVSKLIPTKLTFARFLAAPNYYVTKAGDYSPLQTEA